MATEEQLKIRDKLNKVSPSFCLAKWYQVTIHLQNGQTHSCHHPFTHTVDFRDLDENPTALHNTVWKKYQRYKMLKGERPSECDYCWKIEDSNESNISDRVMKSAEDWAMPNFEEATSKPWDYNFQPRYVEVSFGHSCNFKCIYCMPHISSSIMGEYQKFGHYKELPSLSLENLARMGQLPIPKDKPNPYVDAFWDWWPDLVETLKYFRITGGEPLLNPNTFRFLDYIKENPQPQLNFAVNSNLGIPDAQYDQFLGAMKSILEDRQINHFDFFTSLDTHGAQAEYIRNGLSYQKFMANARKFLETLPRDTKLVVMCTYNALSVTTFDLFLEDIAQLKREYKNSVGEPRVILDIPYLRHPDFLSIAVLTENFGEHMNRSLAFLKDRSVDTLYQDWLFTEHEIAKMERVCNWFASLPREGHKLRKDRKDFYSFIVEHDRRRDKDFLKDFPAMAEFFQLCKDMFMNDVMQNG